MIYLVICLVSYILGSVPFGRMFAGKKIEKEGSKNVGAMNAARVTGKPFMLVVVAALDAGKAFLALLFTYFFRSLGYNITIALLVASIFVVAGHKNPIFLKFQDKGRGLSSLLGIVFFLSWFVFLKTGNYLIWISPFVCIAIMIIAIFSERLFMPRKKTEVRYGKVIDELGSPIIGRLIGMVACLIALIFLLPSEYFAVVLTASLISFIAHIPRAQEYVNTSSS
ncbi:MAG: glycerol-3-phosphate acyltransferase [Candidatus Pacebacteria bacterium]|nr:glycerol-3-phosphate acyltransferase [Candidatus Paceibacterota bacterium]